MPEIKVPYREKEFYEAEGEMYEERARVEEADENQVSPIKQMYEEVLEANGPFGCTFEQFVNVLYALDIAGMAVIEKDLISSLARGEE